MRKNQFTVYLTISFLLASELSLSKEESGSVLPPSNYKKNERLISRPEEIQDHKHIDTMKVRDVIILAKYAQGGVVFDSFLEYFRYMNADERRKLLLQIVVLIKKLEPQDSDAAIAIGKSGLSADCRQSLILGESVTDEKLDELLNVPDEHLEATFKLLVNLFTEGYKRAYAKNRNNASKFWYWDYSIPATSFQILELDAKQEVDISNF